jgi:outer membrane receptor protein involved in Fe transport
MPQGISTYVDGVRVNEPFGDVTLWDKIPNFAIGGMQLVPGSNPMFGLNTLGGAIAIQTKSGREAKGAAVEFEAGSWNRQRYLAEYGGVSKDGSVDYYIGHQTTKEDGWRQFSPSRLNQTFSKLGWQNEKTKLDLSYIGTDNKLIGNGFTPDHLLTGDRDQIHTRPDYTNNYYHHLALNGSHWLSKDVMLSGNTYYRKSNRHTRNGDLYETDVERGFGHDDYNIGTCSSAAIDLECQLAGSVMNATKTRQENYGVTGQLSFNQDIFNKKNQLIVGAGYDFSRIRFTQREHVNIYSQSESIGDLVTANDANSLPTGTATAGSDPVFDASREPILSGPGLQDPRQTTGLIGKHYNLSFFANDTLSINDKWHVNAGARYNHTKVDNFDMLRPATDDKTLTAKHSFNRINPTLGLTFTPSNQLSLFGSYSESSRAPTSMELGCSNPANPCLLPTAMADDPPLKQVVAKTYDFGFKGNLSDNVKWNGSVYHALNHNDIQFVRASDSTSRGYYTNVGQTKRLGLDFGLSGQVDRLRWTASYSYVKATYESDFDLLSGSNSAADNDTYVSPSVGSAAVGDPLDPGYIPAVQYVAADANSNKNLIHVKKGNRLPNIPNHHLKLRAQYQVTPDWSFGANLIGYTAQYVMGNENNAHQANTASCSNGIGLGNLTENDAACGSGKVKGYTVVNLDSQYNIGQGWKAFAKVINIFDQEYNVAGRLAETMFDASGAYGGEIKSLGLIPGAPRAGWIGVRYEFGGAPEAK